MNRLILTCPLLAACIEFTERSGTTGDATYSGHERYEFGENPGELNCDLYWTVTGSDALVSCPECRYAFDLTFTLDESQSSNDGTCFGVPSSYTTTYVLISEAGEYSVGTWDGSSVAVFASADFDEDGGRFWYNTGNTGYAYGAYYYTQYTSGYGLIIE